MCVALCGFVSICIYLCLPLSCCQQQEKFATDFLFGGDLNAVGELFSNLKAKFSFKRKQETSLTVSTIKEHSNHLLNHLSQRLDPWLACVDPSFTLMVVVIQECSLHLLWFFFSSVALEKYTIQITPRIQPSKFWFPQSSLFKLLFCCSNAIMFTTNMVGCVYNPITVTLPPLWFV